MDFTAFNAKMVEDEPIRQYEACGVNYGYEFSLRYPTYRGTWLCNVRDLAVTVDGENVPAKDIRLGLNGKWFMLNELPDLYREYWFTTQSATLRVMKRGGIATGKHEIFVRMSHQIPYTGYFGNYLVVESTCTKQLLAINEGGDAK